MENRATIRCSSILVAALVILSSCGGRATNEPDPLITVIKLQSAETIGDLDEARKYLDAESVYKSWPPDSLTGEQKWEELVRFKKRMAEDKKFTNVFTYYDYDIERTVSGSRAVVTFREKNPDAKFRSENYKLEMRNGNWIVVEIEYVKN